VSRIARHLGDMGVVQSVGTVTIVDTQIDAVRHMVTCQFLPRDAVLAQYKSMMSLCVRLSVRPSVCLSVTSRNSTD